MVEALSEPIAAITSLQSNKRATQVGSMAPLDSMIISMTREEDTLTIHSMQVSVFLETAVVFVLLPTDITCVPKIVCKEGKEHFEKPKRKFAIFPKDVSKPESLYMFNTLFLSFPLLS